MIDQQICPCLAHTSITYPNQPMLHSSWFDRTQKVVIRNQQKEQDCTCFWEYVSKVDHCQNMFAKKEQRTQQRNTSKTFYSSSSKRFPLHALWVAREGVLQLSGCLAAVQMLRYLCVRSLSRCLCGAVDYTLIAPPHALRCMKVLVHPVATPEPLLAICLQSEPAVLVAFCFVKSLACAQSSLPQIQWANSVWKRHSFQHAIQ